MITTTLNKIRAHDPCCEGWQKLLKSLNKTTADDEPLSLEHILNSNGLDNAFWALRTIDGYQNAMRLYACYCAKQALPVFEKEFPDDPRPRQCINVAEMFARGIATNNERDAARAAAKDAAWATAWAAAWAAAWDDFTQEFRRLCRLEGEYGGVGDQ